MSARKAGDAKASQRAAANKDAGQPGIGAPKIALGGTPQNYPCDIVKHKSIELPSSLQWMTDVDNGKMMAYKDGAILLYRVEYSPKGIPTGLHTEATAFLPHHLRGSPVKLSAGKSRCIVTMSRMPAAGIALFALPQLKFIKSVNIKELGMVAPHGVAIDTSGRRAFVCDRNTETYRGSVVVVTLPTLKIQERFGGELTLPTNCVLSSDTTQIFVSHVKGVTAFDTAPRPEGVVPATRHILEKDFEYCFPSQLAIVRGKQEDLIIIKNFLSPLIIKLASSGATVGELDIDKEDFDSAMTCVGEFIFSQRSQAGPKFKCSVYSAHIQPSDFRH